MLKILVKSVYNFVLKFLVKVYTLKSFKNAKVVIQMFFIIYSSSILMKFDTHKHGYVCKLCCKFRVKIMSNVRATVLDISIPLYSKTANNVEHVYNLPLGITSIAILLKA